MSISESLHQLSGRLLDAILPPRCLKCGEIIAAPDGLCSQCWPQMRFLAEPCCACCGYPFEFDQGPGAHCGGCLADPPPFQRCRSALAYDDASRDLVLRFKHADRTDTARVLAAWMGRAGAELVDAADLLIPVPLHWSRLLRRRYNQAGLLAAAIGKETGKPVGMRLLHRIRSTESQGHLSRRERHRNVSGVFRADPAIGDRIARKKILVVDDVLTTGATIKACSKALLKAGAHSVDVLTLARVVKPQTI